MEVNWEELRINTHSIIQMANNGRSKCLSISTYVALFYISTQLERPETPNFSLES